jgi:type IV secretory pathway VirB4 component
MSAGRAAAPAVAARRPGDTGRPQVLRLPFHRGTTAQVSSIYPFQVDGGLGARGICMGLNVLSGDGFYFDPFTLYADKVITNPNVIVLGEVGSAKSSFVKTMMARHVGLLGQRGAGRQVFALDPKQEYEALAHAVGIPILQLRPGGHRRVNPLAAAADGESAGELLVRRTQLLVALLSSIKGRRLDAIEHAVLAWALEALADRERPHRSPTLRDLAGELADPSEVTASRARRARDELREDARGLWLDVDRLVSRDLAGMFDGEEPLASLWEQSGRGLVLDVSAVFHDRQLLSLVMLAAVSALQSVFATPAGCDERALPRRLSVVDEGWAVLGDEDAARFFQSSLKLSRKWGISNVLVFHRITDAGAQSDSGTAAAKIADGLIADAEIKVIFRTHPRVLQQTATAFALSEEEAAALPSLPRGRALWKLAGTSAFVDHVRSDFEARFTDTDSRLEV